MENETIPVRRGASTLSRGAVAAWVAGGSIFLAGLLALRSGDAPASSSAARPAPFAVPAQSPAEPDRNSSLALVMPAPRAVTRTTASMPARQDAGKALARLFAEGRIPIRGFRDAVRKAPKVKTRRRLPAVLRPLPGSDTPGLSGSVAATAGISRGGAGLFPGEGARGKAGASGAQFREARAGSMPSARPGSAKGKAQQGIHGGDLNGRSNVGASARLQSSIEGVADRVGLSGESADLSADGMSSNSSADEPVANQGTRLELNSRGASSPIDGNAALLNRLATVSGGTDVIGAGSDSSASRSGAQPPAATTTRNSYTSIIPSVDAGTAVQAESAMLTWAAFTSLQGSRGTAVDPSARRMANNTGEDGYFWGTNSVGQKVVYKGYIGGPGIAWGLRSTRDARGNVVLGGATSISGIIPGTDIGWPIDGLAPALIAWMLFTDPGVLMAGQAAGIDPASAAAAHERTAAPGTQSYEGVEGVYDLGQNGIYYNADGSQGGRLVEDSLGGHAVLDVNGAVGGRVTIEDIPGDDGGGYYDYTPGETITGAQGTFTNVPDNSGGSFVYDATGTLIATTRPDAGGGLIVYDTAGNAAGTATVNGGNYTYTPRAG